MTPGKCDVVGCEQDATRAYIEPSGDRRLEFCVCVDHFIRLEGGARPVIVAERFDLAQMDARPALLLD